MYWRTLNVRESARLPVITRSMASETRPPQNNFQQVSSGERPSVRNRPSIRTVPYRPPLRSSYFMHSNQRYSQTPQTRYHWRPESQTKKPDSDSDRNHPPVSISFQPSRPHVVTSINHYPCVQAPQPHTQSSGMGSSPHSGTGTRHYSSRVPVSLPRRPRVYVGNYRKDSNKTRYPFVSVVTYNLLAQDLLNKNMFLYRTDFLDLLQWDYRKKKLLKEMLEMHADIFCFQEVQEDHYYDWYYPQLKANGYGGVFQKRTGHYTDGCAVFYSRKLQMLEHEKICFQKNRGTLIRDNVGIIAKFTFTPDYYSASNNSCCNSTFCVATTHLLFNHKAGEIKLSQICYLMAKLYKMATTSTSSHHVLPSILCGDFNSLPYSPMINFLLTKKLDYSQLDSWDISGYKSSQAKYRPIPVPLLHGSFGINQDCLHVHENEEGAIRPSQGKLPNSVQNNDCQVDTSQTKRESFAQNTSQKTSIEPKSQVTNNSTTIPASQTPPILTHPFNFVSGYPIPRDQDCSPMVTTYHRSACEMVDFVFYTPTVSDQGAGFHLVSRTALPSQHILRQHGPLPNDVYSSDHLFLQVDLQLIG